MALFARWFTWDALKSIFWGIGITAAFGGLVVIYNDIKGGATAQARLECTEANAAANQATQTYVDTVNAASESAAQAMRDKRKNDGGKATARALSIQSELQKLAPAGDPVCFPKDLAKAMGQ